MQQSPTFVSYEKPKVINDRSWIGARAVIPHGCSEIGVGATVAASAVATKDAPSYTVIAGNLANNKIL